MSGQQEDPVNDSLEFKCKLQNGGFEKWKGHVPTLSGEIISLLHLRKESPWPPVFDSDLFIPCSICMDVWSSTSYSDY